MENLKFVLFSIFMLMLLALLGYWAIFNIESGGVHADKQKQEELEEENTVLKKEVEELKDEIASLQALREEQIQEEKPIVVSVDSTATASKHNNLINDLQKLIDDKVFMKEKSRGARVGTLQTFLNIYNNTSKKVDNDYGPGMKADIVAFQKAEGLTADGEAGPGTFAKMIEWLKKQ